MEKLNPPSLLDPVGGNHVHIVIPPANSRLAFLAGQVAFAKSGEIVGKGDYYKQAVQCFANIRDALIALDAGPEQVAKMTIFVVDYRPEYLDFVADAGREIFGDRWPVTATTLIGVQALGIPDFLIEIEAIAALPA